MDSVLLNATKNLLSPEKPVIVSIQNRKFKCPYCEQKFERKKLPIHIQNQHEELIPEGHTALRIAFNSINHKTEGHCIICKNVSDWNEDKGRYERLCSNPRCHEEYKKIVAERNKKKYGTERLQTDPKYAAFVQTKALAGRSISGDYKFTDGGVISYVGSYEKKLLEFMDIVMHCKSEDIVSPGPAIDYFLDGQKHLYIPDFFYEPYQLLIEIKDGGSNPNNHPHRIEEEKKNKAKEAAVKKLNKYSYVRVVNNDFSQLLTAMAILKYNMIDNDSNPIIMTHESAILESEQKSILEKDHKQKGSKRLSDFKLEVKERDNSDKTLKRLVLEWKENRKLVATVTVDKSAREEDGLWYRWFGHFNVNKSYRGYGLGKQIVEFIKKKYKAGALAVYKDNEIAVKLYKQCGFIIGKETDTSYWMYYPPNREKAYNESMVLESEDKSVLEKDHKQKGSMKLSDLKLEVQNTNYSKDEKDFGAFKCFSLKWFTKDGRRHVAHVDVDQSPASDGYYWFGNFGVIKEYRGNGLGKQIVEFIKSKYKAGALGVAKDNEIAIRLYKQCGFKELERKDPKGKYLYLYYPPNKEKATEKINEATKIKRIKELYFISDKDFDNKILKPRVPNHLSNRRGEEENKTGRVCFAPTIKECLRAIPQDDVRKGKEFYVHIPKGKYTVYRPSTKEVADSIVTNEHWICEPVKLECIGKIKLTDKYDSGEIFSYKGEDFTVYDWNYDWIEKKNTEKALKESLEEIDINQKFIGSDKQSAIINLNKILNDFNYGIIVNGKIITNNINFDHYKTLSCKDFLKYKTGVCWDYTHFEAIYFSNNLGMKLTKDELKNNTFSMYYMEFEDEDGDCPTHTWLGYKLDNKIYAFESSWKQYRGVTEFESEDDMIQTYIERQKDFYNSIKNPIYNPELFKYSPMKKSGLTPEVFMSTVHKEGKALFEADMQLIYRITSGGEGVYIPLKREMGQEKWLKFKKDPRCNWLPLPSVYNDNPNESYIAYFTKLGRDTFVQKTLPICKKYLSEITEEVYSLNNAKVGVSYKDKYQILVPEEKIQQIKLVNSHNLSNLNESVINESILFNDEDLYYNKDKFDSGEINLCFITGHSGSGKTTMGDTMQKSSNIEHYDLDDLQCPADHFTLDQLKKYGDLYYSFFTGIGKKYYLTLDELKSSDLWKREAEYERNLFKTFIPYAMKYAKAHKNKKIVCNGIWIYIKDWFKPQDFKDYAFYIKGTSLLISKIRADRRDKKGVIRFLTRNWKFYNMSEKRIREFRTYFENLMKKNEALELSNPIDTIVFDIGKVLTHRNPEGEKLISQWARKHHLTDEDMNNLWAAWDGHKDDYKEHQSLKNAKVLFREFVAPEYHHLVNDWFTMLGKYARIVANYVKPMLSTLKKKGYKLYFLSNMRQYIYEILQEANKFGSIKKYFSGGIYSFQTPYRKPDINIYKVLIDKYQINPETSLFIDDKPENVEAARSLGFNGLVFEGDAFSTCKNNPIIKDLIDLKSISSSINEVIENMSGTIGAALPPGGSIPYYPNKNNYYVIQYPLNNVFAYGITSDPLQNTIYGVEYLDNNQYKVYKTDKTKIGKNYLTYKIKNSKNGEELYNELASCIQYNKRKFYDSCKNPQQYIYERLSENSSISLQFDQAFELVPNPNLEVKQLCNEIYSYLKQPSNLQLLEKQINSLSKRQTINEDTNNGTDQETQKVSNSTEIPKEFYNDWDLKKKRAAEAETMGMIIMVPKNMTPSIITKDDIDELKHKHERLQSITSHKRVLSNTTASSIFGVNNDRLYDMILSAYSRI